MVLLEDIEGQSEEQVEDVNPVLIVVQPAKEGPRPPEVRVFDYRGYRVQWDDSGRWQVYAPNTGAVRQLNDLFWDEEAAKGWIDQHAGPEPCEEEKLARRALDFTRLIARLFTRHAELVDVDHPGGQMIYDNTAPKATWFAGEIAYEVTVRAFIPVKPTDAEIYAALDDVTGEGRR